MKKPRDKTRIRVLSEPLKRNLAGYFSILPVFVLLFFYSSSYGQTIFINELHYDNVGQDTLEGIEIAAPAGTDLSCYRVVWYNGANGLEYGNQLLTGIVPDLCNGYGTLWFGFNGNQNGNDGLALIYSPSMASCSVGSGPDSMLQFISYEGSFQANNGPALDSIAIDLIVAEPLNNPIGLDLQLSGTGINYGDFTWQPPAAHTIGLPNTGQVFNGGASCIPGIVSRDTLTFSLNASGCILPDSTFSVTVCATDYSGFADPSYSGSITLSKASGPGSLSGTLTQVASNGCATFTGLSLSGVGGYRLAASDGSMSGLSAPTYISASCDSCPWMTGAMIDACQGNEGNNEILFFNSGNFSIPLIGTSLNVTYGGTNPPQNSYTVNLMGNSDYVDSLNSRAACGSPIFLNAADTSPIPPGADFMVMRWNPTRIYNFSDWCGRPPIYVVFSFDPNWNTTGNFKNCVNCGTTGSTPRYFNIDFTGLSGGDTCDFLYSYVPCSDLVCAGNGDGLSFGYGGGTPTASWNQCEPTQVLAVEYAQALQGIRDHNGSSLSWAFFAGSNVYGIEIQRSSSAEGSFSSIAQLSAQQSHFIDQEAANIKESLFYRLKTLDLNGEISFSKTLELKRPETELDGEIRVSQDQIGIVFSSPGKSMKVNIYGVNGKLYYTGLSSGQTGNVRLKIEKQNIPIGLMMYLVQVDGKSYSGKLMLR